MGFNRLTRGRIGIGAGFFTIVRVHTFTFDPANLADGAGVTSADQTVAGAALSDFVLVAAPYDLQGVLTVGYVKAANTVVVRLQNESGGAVDLGSGVWKVWCFARSAVRRKEAMNETSERSELEARRAVLALRVEEGDRPAAKDLERVERDLLKLALIDERHALARRARAARAQAEEQEAEKEQRRKMLAEFREARAGAVEVSAEFEQSLEVLHTKVERLIGLGEQMYLASAALGVRHERLRMTGRSRHGWRRCFTPSPALGPIEACEAGSSTRCPRCRGSRRPSAPATR